MKSDFIWMDGELVPYEQANVHVITPTLHYGVGVFEGIRCYQTSQGPAVFRLKEHLARLLDSIHILGIRDFPYSLPEMQHAVHQTILVNGFHECYIRPLMYLEGPMGMNMDLSRPRLSIAAWEWGPYLGEESKTGRHSYDGFVIDSPASQCEHDQIQGYRELCEFLTGEDLGLAFRL